MRGNKYHAKAVTVDGMRFASKKEAARYRELKLLESAGKISDLRLQVRYNLVPPKKPLRGVDYIADFVYRDSDGQLVVEDVKGVKTRVYSLKKN